MRNFKKILQPSSTWKLDPDWTIKALKAIETSCKFCIVPKEAEIRGRLAPGGVSIYKIPLYTNAQTAWEYYREEPFSAVMHVISLLPTLAVTLRNASREFEYNSSLHSQLNVRIYDSSIEFLRNNLMVRDQVGEVEAILLSHPPNDWQIDSIVHDDLHPGNVLIKESRYWRPGISHRIIDFENLTVSNYFNDFLSLAGYLYEKPEIFERNLKILQIGVGRRIQRSDFARPIAKAVYSLMETRDANMEKIHLKCIKTLLFEYSRIGIESDY